jgi:lipid-A-disaccharide synthase
MIQVMMAAGEVSGDLHGANLAKALLKERGLSIFGMGGQRMKEAGVEILDSTIHLSSVGFSEPLRSIPRLYRTLKRLTKAIKERRPRAAILIDNQGFNLHLAKTLKREGIAVLYYLPPQIWAFGGWEAKGIARLITHILAVFRFEEEAWLEAGAKVSFIGHPFLDMVHPTLPREDAKRYFGLKPDLPTIGLLPGSRTHEISRHLPILLDGAKELMMERPALQFILPLADPIFKEMVLDGLKRKDGPPVTLVEELRYDAINVCDLIITSSGTATLEAALLGVPMIIIYRTSAFTWWISRLIVKTRFAGMPNIILKRPIVKELLQGDLGPKEIKEEAIRILDSEEEVYRIKRDLSYLVPYLGEPGAIGRARDIILSYL